ncbi:MAG TPA: hypothetical protein VGB08_03030 [Allosphingosinicella sp.]|jgi:hypothetical protein
MASRPLAANVPGLLFAGAILTSLPVLWFFATPILDTSEGASHLRHGTTPYLHVIGGLACERLRFVTSQSPSCGA